MVRYKSTGGIKGINAAVVELADTLVLGTSAFIGVRVRVSPAAHRFSKNQKQRPARVLFLVKVIELTIRSWWSLYCQN